MKTKIIDGVECEITFEANIALGSKVIHYRPLPKPKKTLVEIAADACNADVVNYRMNYVGTCAALDEIDRRLEALGK